MGDGPTKRSRRECYPFAALLLVPIPSSRPSLFVAVLGTFGNHNFSPSAPSKAQTLTLTLIGQEKREAGGIRLTHLDSIPGKPDLSQVALPIFQIFRNFFLLFFDRYSIYVFITIYPEICLNPIISTIFFFLFVLGIRVRGPFFFSKP